MGAAGGAGDAAVAMAKLLENVGSAATGFSCSRVIIPLYGWQRQEIKQFWCDYRNICAIIRSDWN
jgi:hypothetical protein